MEVLDDFRQGELFRLTFETGSAEQCEAGFYAQDRVVQTEITEIIAVKELTEAVDRLTKECNVMKQDISLTKAVMTSEFSQRLERKALELYTRMNNQVNELEHNHNERVATVRKAFKMQLTDALIRVKALYDQDLSHKFRKVQEAHNAQVANLEARIKTLQESLRAQKGVISKLKSTIDDLEFERNELKAELSTSQRENTALSLRTKSKTSKSKSATPEGTPSPRYTQADIDEKLDEIENLQKKIEDLEENLRSQASASQSASAQLADERAQLANERAQLEAEMAGQRSQIDELTQRNDSLLTRIKELQEEVEKAKSSNEEQWKKQIEERINSARNKAKEQEKALIEQIKKENQSKYDSLMNEKQLQEKKWAAERNEFLLKLEKLKDVEQLKKRETLLQTQVDKLKAELNYMTKVWEKKFQVLRQSLHAIKDESYLRQTMQRQAAQLHQAAVMYANDLPQNTPLPNLPQARQPPAKDHFSYTVSHPSKPTSGIGFFSEDEDQVVSSDNEDAVLPPGIRPLPSIDHNNSQPSVQTH